MEKDKMVKEHLLKMAKMFHNFCIEHDIKYYMIGGTLLGAVRHKGFIPWDDDMDFGVMREDYEKLKKIHNEIPEGYSLNFYEINRDFQYGFCKLYDENTTYIERLYDDAAVGGVYIDIFPIDDIGDDLLKAQKLAKKIDFRKKIVASIYAKGKRSSTIKTVGVKLLSLLPKSTAWFSWVYNCIEKYKGTQSKYVLNVYGIYKEKEIAERRVLGTPKLYDFEDTQLYGVENADEYLTKIYGDYMTPPPEDKRGGHSISYIDFNMPYKKYRKSGKQPENQERCN